MSGIESENLTLNIRSRIIRSVEEATVEALLAGIPTCETRPNARNRL